MISLGPVPLGGDSEEEGITWAEIFPGEQEVQTTYWARQPWGPTLERRAPLAGWRAGETNRRTVGSLDSAHDEGAHTCLLLKQV